MSDYDRPFPTTGDLVRILEGRNKGKLKRITHMTLRNDGCWLYWVEINGKPVSFRIDQIEHADAEHIPLVAEDYSCDKCGKALEVGSYPFCPHESVLRGHNNSFEPIMYFEGPGGKVMYAGRKDDPIPKGFVRRELHNIPEVRAFNRRQDERERSLHDRKSEARAEIDERRESAMRSDLRSRLRTRGGKEAFERACQLNNARPRYTPYKGRNYNVAIDA